MCPDPPGGYSLGAKRASRTFVSAEAPFEDAHIDECFVDVSIKVVSESEN
jgi:hypothetical protein